MSLSSRHWIPTRHVLCAALAASALVNVSGCAAWRSWFGTDDGVSRRLIAEAQRANAEGNHARADVMLGEACELLPNDPDIRWERFVLLRDQGRTDEALEQIQEVIRLSPDDPRTLTELARLRFDRQQNESAMRVVDDALELDPQHIPALKLLARIWRAEGDSARAVETYHRILHLVPEQSDVRLAIAGIHLENQRPSRAAPLLRQVIAATTTNVDDRNESKWALGIAYGQMGRWDAAASTLAEAAMIPEGHDDDERLGPPRFDRRLAVNQLYLAAYAAVQSRQFPLAMSVADAMLERQPHSSTAAHIRELCRGGRREGGRSLPADRRIARHEIQTASAQWMGRGTTSALPIPACWTRSTSSPSLR